MSISLKNIFFFVLEFPFRSDNHINRHDRRVFGAEQLHDTFHRKSHQDKMTLGCRLLYDCTIWTSQDDTVWKSVYLYYLYFSTLAKLYFCMTVCIVILYDYLHFYVAIALVGHCPPQYWGFTITLRHTTLDRTPPVKWPAQRRDLYLTTHNTHKREKSMPEVGFKPGIPASERPHTHAFRSSGSALYECMVRNSVWS
jgi:hypothetical protein